MRKRPHPTAPPLSADFLRDAARRAVEIWSARKVAADVGISPGGLRNILYGATPYSATLRKLRIWYAKHAAAIHGLTPEAAEAAILTLVEMVPPDVRKSAREGIVGALRVACEGGGYVPPPQLDVLVRETECP